MKSLKAQLIIWLAGLLTVMGLLASGISFYFALDEANGLLDQQLKQIASSVDEGSRLTAMQNSFNKEIQSEKQRDFIIQVWVGKEHGRSSRPNFRLPRSVVSGFSDMTAYGSKWRVFTAIYPDRTVQIAQAEEVRLDIAMHSAIRVLLPFAVVTVFSWLLIGVVVSRLLKPLEKVTEVAVNRDVSSHSLLPSDHVPVEVVPLIHAMNDLISRLSAAIELQRQFLSDAAHELRTPLAALQLQIENMSRNRSQEDLDIRLDEMRRGSQRASHLVGQLLKISRYETQQHSTIRRLIKLNDLVKDIIADFIPIAHHRGIDLGMVDDDDVFIIGNHEDIRILLGNLIDNAIRYTSTGGMVDVSVSAVGHSATVTILDTGPGVVEALLPRLFDRFFRVAGQEIEGSGIGLSIVKAIAQSECAQVTLTNRQNVPGLCATVIFEAKST